MLQFYFLSILVNFFGGAVLAAAFLEKRLSLFGGLEEFIEERGSLVLGWGIVALLVGVLKLLSVVEGDMKILGDLLPSLASIMVGLSLLTGHYRNRTDVQAETGFSTFLEKYQVVIGLSSMAVAVLHFFIPRVLFL